MIKTVTTNLVETISGKSSAQDLQQHIYRITSSLEMLCGMSDGKKSRKKWNIGLKKILLSCLQFSSIKGKWILANFRPISKNVKIDDK